MNKHYGTKMMAGNKNVWSGISLKESDLLF